MNENRESEATEKEERSEESIDTNIEIVFRGNESFDQNVLREVIRNELESLSTLQRSASDLIDAAFTLESWYSQRGFPEADVSVRMIDTDNEQYFSIITDAARFAQVDRAEFLIAEGKRLYLGKVTFSGNQAFNDEILEAYIPRRGGEFLGTGRPFYRPGDIQTAVSNIRKHYLLEGYLRAEIGEPEVNQVNDSVNVHININEGRIFTITSVDINGIESLPKDVASLVRNEKPAAGSPYTERIAADTAYDIEQILGNSGFLTNVRYSLLTDDETGTVSLLYEFDKVPRSVIGNIKIRSGEEGDLRTLRGVIVGQFDIRSGEPVNRSRINQGRQRLYQTGLFQLVTTELVAREEDSADGPKQSGVGEEETDSGSSRITGNPPRVVDLVVTLTEAQNQYIAVSAGYNNIDQLIGSVEFVDENVFGTGRKWSIEVDGSFRGYGVTTRLSDRLLLGPESRLVLSLGHRLKLRESYSERSSSANLLADIFLTDILRYNANYHFAVKQIDDLTQSSTGLRTVRIGELDLGFALNTVDSVLSPTTGLAAEIGVGLSGGPIGSQLDYIRLSGILALHLQIVQGLVITIGGDGETLLPSEPGSIPISERLYAGGSASVRSFPEDSLSPVNAEGEALGGLTRLEGSLEVRIDLFAGFALALFSDIGLVARDSLSLTPPGYGIGLGLRYKLPIGPVRLDFGYNPGPRFAADSSWALHFSIGGGF